MHFTPEQGTSQDLSDRMQKENELCMSSIMKSTFFFYFINKCRCWDLSGRSRGEYNWSGIAEPNALLYKGQAGHALQKSKSTPVLSKNT